MCIQTAFCSFCVRRMSMEIKIYIFRNIVLSRLRGDIICGPEMIQCEGFTEANP